MNPLKKAQERYAQICKELTTETDGAKLAKLVEEGEALQAEIQTLQKAADIIKWGEAPSGEHKMQFGQQVDTDSIGFDENGNARKVEEGKGLPAKAWATIREPSYKAAWLRHAANPGYVDHADRKILEDALREAKNFQEGLDPAGGYLVPADIVMEIIKRDPMPSNVVDLVRSIPTGSDRIQAPRLDYTGASDDSNGDIFDNPMRIQWTGEASVPGTTTRPVFGQVDVPVYEGVFEMPYSRTLAEDAGSFFSEFLAEELRNTYRLGLESVIVGGNGVAKPSGILLNPGGAYQPPTVNVGNPATADGLADWINDLPEQYATADCRWVTNKVSTYKQWFKLKDTAGNYIFGLTSNIAGGMATVRAANLFGYDGGFSPFVPAAAGAANVGIFGNFRRAYWLAERLGMQVRFQDLPREAFAYAVTRFRIGGQVVQGRALRVAVQS